MSHDLKILKLSISLPADASLNKSLRADPLVPLFNGAKMPEPAGGCLLRCLGIPPILTAHRRQWCRALLFLSGRPNQGTQFGSDSPSSGGASGIGYAEKTA